MLLEKSIVYKPFQYPELMEAAKLHEKIHWVEEEITNLPEDVRDYNTLSAHEKSIIENILKLFTQSDVAVGQWYIDKILPLIQNNEARCWLLSAAAREGIHQRAYALLNDTLGLDDTIYTKFVNYAAAKTKFEFMLRNNTGSTSQQKLALDTAQLVLMEGVMLFGAFITLLNFPRVEAGGRMRGCGKIVEWSLRDESMHVQYNSFLFKQICKEHPEIVTDGFKRKLYQMGNTVLSMEWDFLKECYVDGDLPALKLDDVCEYMGYLTDRRMLQLGLKPIIGVKEHKLKWLDEVMLLTTHGNFFEVPVSEYGIGGMVGEWNKY